MNKLTTMPDFLPYTNRKTRKKPGVYENEGGGEQFSQSAVYDQYRLQTSKAVQNKKCQTSPNQRPPVASEERSQKKKNKQDVNTIRPSSNIILGNRKRIQSTPRCYSKSQEDQEEQHDQKSDERMEHEL